MIKLLDQKGLLELDSFPVNLSRYSKQRIFKIKYLKNMHFAKMRLFM